MVQISVKKTKSTLWISFIAFWAWTISVYDYILFGNLLPVIQNYYGWSSAEIGLLGTLVALATLLPAFTVGPILDRLGRVKGIAITTGAVALSSFLSGLTIFFSGIAAFVWLVFARLFSGFGYSEQAANSAYLTEIYKEKTRGTIYSFVQGGWPIGVLLGAAFIYGLISSVSWAEIFWYATIPAIIIAIAALLVLPETERYIHISKVREYLKLGKVEETKKLIDTYKVDLEEAKKFTYIQLFGRGLRKHTIFLSSAFFTNWMGVEIYIIFITLILTTVKSVAFTSTLIWLIIANALSYIGYVIHGIIGDKIGRRETIMMGWIISGIAGTILLVAPIYDPTIIEILYIINLFFLIGPYSALFTYMGESFPTRARGTGVAFVNAMGPIGGLAGAAIFTALLATNVNMAIAGVIAGGIPTILSGLLLLGARRIKPGMKLEDISY
jgi:MFS family permease